MKTNKDKAKKQMALIPVIERDQCGYCMKHTCKGTCYERRHFWNTSNDDDDDSVQSIGDE